MSAVRSCPVCATPGCEIFFERRGVLVFCNVLYPSRDRALLAPRGDLQLAFCGACTHIFNAAFDPDQSGYGVGYENALHFSETFGAYQRRLAERLIDRFGLYGKDLVEIGCGDGSFLRLLCELGDNRGVGFDPTAPENSDDPRVRFVMTTDRPADADVPADFICCRHALEHIERPRPFAARLAGWVKEGSGAFYIEVPNGLAPFCDDAVWDLIYEHCSYFTPLSLRRLCEGVGMEVWASDFAFDGQYLSIEGRCGARNQQGGQPRQPEDLRVHLGAFAESYAKRTSVAVEWTHRAAGAGERVVLWGAGSKGVSFLDAVGGAGIAAAVDVNPRKQGKWVGGSGVEVVAPEKLVEIRPDLVVMLNPIYRDEVGAALRSLGLLPELVTLSA